MGAARARRKPDDAPAPRRPKAKPRARTPAGDDEIRGALKLVAIREHSLRSFSELAASMSRSPDLFHLADVVLFSLMGQFATSRAAFWLSSETSQTMPVLLRSHGVDRRIAREIALSAGPVLLQLPPETLGPFRPEDLGMMCGARAEELARESVLSWFARLPGLETSPGFLALGARIGRQPYGPVEAQSLAASLNMLSVAVQNHTLYSRLTENNRLLRQANEELKELDRLKSDILSNVSHELRTPLSVIIGYVECLQVPNLSPERMQDMIGKAITEAFKLEQIVEQLVTYSAASHNRLVLNLEIASPARCLARWHKERLPGISERLREFTCVIEPDLPEIRFDEKRLLQVTDALLDNAVKFTPEGGHVQARVFRTEVAEGTCVAIEITDDGPGLAPERVANLFDAFRQADGSSTRAIGGMGIGLAFSRELVQAMGGTIGVVSTPGQGSTFTVLMPQA